MSDLLIEALAKMDEETRTAFLAHLDGGSSANWLSDWLERFGSPISPTTLKACRKQRRKEREAGR